MEFWRSYSKYFSILEAIALGNTKKNEISNHTGISTDSLGIYLQKLDKFYELIVRNTSLDSKKATTNSRYKIKDPFLNFWFKYVFKNENYLEIWDFESLKNLVKDDMDRFLGFSFEKMSREFFIRENLEGRLPFRFDTIGNYFDKQWTNEIDLIIRNAKERKIMFIECKLNTEKIDIHALEVLRQKAYSLWKYRNFERYYGFMSVERSEYAFSDERVLTFGLNLP